MSSDFLEQLKRLNATAPREPVFAPTVPKTAHEPEAKDGSKLASLWKQAKAVQLHVDSNANPFYDLTIVALQIESAERPISLTEGDGWLASVKKEEDKWIVGVYRSRLAAHFNVGPDGKAVDEILTLTKDLKPEMWLRYTPLGVEDRGPAIG